MPAAHCCFAAFVINAFKKSLEITRFRGRTKTFAALNCTLHDPSHNTFLNNKRALRVGGPALFRPKSEGLPKRFMPCPTFFDQLTNLICNTLGLDDLNFGASAYCWEGGDKCFAALSTTAPTATPCCMRSKKKHTMYNDDV